MDWACPDLSLICCCSIDNRALRFASVSMVTGPPSVSITGTVAVSTGPEVESATIIDSTFSRSNAHPALRLPGFRSTNALRHGVSRCRSESCCSSRSRRRKLPTPQLRLLQRMDPAPGQELVQVPEQEEEQEQEPESQRPKVTAAALPKPVVMATVRDFAQRLTGRLHSG